MNDYPQITRTTTLCCCIVHFPEEDATCVVVKCILQT